MWVCRCVYANEVSITSSVEHYTWAPAFLTCLRASSSALPFPSLALPSAPCPFFSRLVSTFGCLCDARVTWQINNSVSILSPQFPATTRPALTRLGMTQDSLDLLPPFPGFLCALGSAPIPWHTLQSHFLLQISPSLFLFISFSIQRAL